MYKAFLIKYAEIAIKGKNRYIFEDALVQQIKYQLRNVEGTFKVVKEMGRIFVYPQDEFDYEEAVEALKRVFGIYGICPAVVLEDQGFQQLSKDVAEYVKKVYGEKALTFKVNTRRNKKSYPMQSMEVSSELGAVILDACPNMKVDVHNPQVTVNVEIRNKIYLYSENIPGPGGMPLGTNGSAMLLLSGGIDSPVAGYMIAKRGVTIDAVYFHAPPYTSERAKQKVIDLAEQIAKYTGSLKLHIVPFTDTQLKIYESTPPEKMTVLLKRAMLKTAQKIAEKNKSMALVTGDSIGQVASQTMEAIVAIDSAATIPVLRPLCAMDKQEIIDVAVEIGTYDISIRPYEDCCTVFVAKHPETKPKKSIIESIERKIDSLDELMDKAVENTETVEF